MLQVIAELEPYVKLAERLGRLAVQLVSGGAGVKDVKVIYKSARADDDLDTRLMRGSITKGLIEPVSSAYVNLVNADYVAKERGLRISEERQPTDGAVETPLESITVSYLQWLSQHRISWSCTKAQQLRSTGFLKKLR